MNEQIQKLIKRQERFNTLCRNVFGSAEGAELMLLLETLFVDIQLFNSDELIMTYNVAQRDLIMEMKSHISQPIEEV